MRGSRRVYLCGEGGRSVGVGELGGMFDLVSLLEDHERIKASVLVWGRGASVGVGELGGMFNLVSLLDDHERIKAS
eukprot:32989-Chlamydomonas_euryale.AAC.2